MLLQHAMRRRMLGGELLIGGWCSLSDPMACEIMGRSGYDWLLVDMEHAPVPLGAAQAMLTAIRTTPAVPLARVPWNDSASIQTALDNGPHGVLVPMISTFEDALSVVRDTRFTPLGERSRGGLRSALAFGTDGPTYFANANDETIVMVQVETQAAIENADAIAALEGIDCLFVGPNDLAAAYSVPWPKVWDDLRGPYADAVRLIPEVARRHGKAAGILANSAAMGARCVEMGYTVVGIASDANILAAAAKSQRNELTTLLGSAGGRQESPSRR